MDADVQLALIEKARIVFGAKDDVFLSFPLLSPITFSPQALEAVIAPTSAADYRQASDFARLVNFIPRDMVASFDGDEVLWDIYADVLTRAEAATGRMDPADEARLLAARALLYVQDAEGVRRESQTYSDYRRYRDAWLVAREDYNAHRITGEAGGDPGVAEQWRDVDEPRLRGIVDAAEAEWEALGARAAIEGALVEERAAAANDPQARWAEWSAGFNPDIDMLEDGLGRFAPTAFSPSDLSAPENWLSTELSRAEIDGLIAGAPPALTAVLADGDRSDIEQVSFEYRSVALNRQWFSSSALASRIWRMEGEAPLSDGGDPPQGRLPAYVAALVFVRHVKIKTRARPETFQTLPFVFSLPVERLTPRRFSLNPAILARHVQPQPDPIELTPKLVTGFQKLRPQTFSAAVRAAPRLEQAVAIGPAFARRAVPLEALSPIRPGRFERLRPWPRPPLTPVEPTPPPPPAAPPPEDVGTVSVLAFICKRLPATPDPLPGLVWR